MIMDWLRSLSKFIASIGQNIQFVAFWAHLGVAALIVEHVYHSHPLYTVIVVIVAGAVKEFVFDAREETEPPQTLADNTEDWAGWASGALLGYGFVVGWW